MTKKTAEKIRNDFYKEMHQASERKLYNCSARTYETDSRVYLVSYKTLVAFYDVNTNTVYQYGRYSATTYQHQRKFIKMLIESGRAAEYPEIENLMIDDWYKAA